MRDSTKRTRRLSRREAVNLLVEFGEAYSLGAKAGPISYEEHARVFALAERALKHLTGKDAVCEDVESVLPY